MKQKQRTQNQDLSTLSDTALRAGGQPNTNDISAKAYELYMKEGCPPDRALDHWLAAEASVHLPAN